MEEIEINTIDDLHNYLHNQVIEDMKAIENGEDVKPREKVKLLFSEELLRLGMETITEIMMMKSINSALNDPYLKSKGECVHNVHESVTFKNTILPILSGNEKITYH